MIFRCSKSALLKGLQAVSRAVSTKNTLPALSSIYLEAAGDELILRATDMELAIEYREKDVAIERSGSVILPGRYLLEITKKLPETELVIELEQHVMTIRYGSSVTEINGYDQTDFPEFPEVRGRMTGTLSLDILRKVVREVAVAASYDETRRVFTGILLDINGSEIKIVATDTHRLALKECGWSTANTDQTAFLIVPNKVMQEISKMGGEDEGSVEIAVEDKQISFRLGNTLVISRLIDGKYPNYMQVVPEEDKTAAVITVGREEMLSSLERASVLVREQIREKIGRLRLVINDQVMTVESQAAEIGSIHEELPVLHEGGDMEIVCNVRYLVDILRALECDEVTLSLTSPTKPMVVRAKGDETYLYLLMLLKS